LNIPPLTVRPPAVIALPPVARLPDVRVNIPRASFPPMAEFNVAVSSVLTIRLPVPPEALSTAPNVTAPVSPVPAVRVFVSLIVTSPKVKAPPAVSTIESELTVTALK